MKGPDARVHYEYHAKHHSAAYVGEKVIVTGHIVDKYVKRGRPYLWYYLEVTHLGRAPGNDLQRSDRAPVQGRRERNDERQAELQRRRRARRAGSRHHAAQRIEWYDSAMLSAATNELRQVGVNIHTDEEFARSEGFPTANADGMIMTNWCSEMLLRAFGMDYLERGELRTKYIKPVNLGVPAARARPDQGGDEAAERQHALHDRRVVRGRAGHEARRRRCQGRRRPATRRPSASSATRVRWSRNPLHRSRTSGRSWSRARSP